MKKHFIGFAIILILSSIALTAYSGPVINIQLKIGKRSCNCCGFGFCGLVLTGVKWNPANDSKIIPGSQEAFGTATIDNGKMVLDLPLNGMIAETATKYFSGEYYTVDEDFTIPRDICSSLGIKTYTIKKGKYQIEKSSGSYKIKL